MLTLSYVSMSKGQGVATWAPKRSSSEMIVGERRTIAQHLSIEKTVQKAFRRSPRYNSESVSPINKVKI